MNRLIIAFLSVSLLILVDGSHFRGGFISWEVTSPLTVHFSISHAWRADFADGIGFVYGDGTYDYFYPQNQLFLGVDAEGEAYRVFHVEVNHTYPAAGVYYAHWESCCRVYTVINSPSSDFRVRTIVDLSGPATYNSPVASLPPLIQVPISPTATYSIGVADPLGFTCSIAQYQDTYINGIANINGNSVSVTPSCELNWNTQNGRVGDKYAISITVQQVGTQTVVPLDFIAEMIPQSYLPTFQVVPYNPVVVLGKAFTVTITATSGRPNVNALTLSVLGLAGDATVTPAPGITNAIPYQVLFTSQARIPGSFSTVLVFTDPDNYQSTYTISYSVIKPINCQVVSFDSCYTLNDLTYYNFNSDPASDYSFSNNCTGVFSNQTGSFNFTSTQAPNTVCSFGLNVSKDGGAENAACSLSLTCPLCTSQSQSGSVKTICRKDQPPVYTVLPALSIDRHLNGDTLATVVDADASIVRSSAQKLPAGVGLLPNGAFYVSSRPDLVEGTFNVTVTNVDAFGGSYTQIVTIVLLRVVCGAGLSPCGAACYDPNNLNCVIGNNEFLLCPSGQIFCPNSTNTCYNPSAQICVAGTLCPIGSAICGTGCFNPSQLTCNQGDNGAYTLCPVTLGFCGNGCYDPNGSDCVDGAVHAKGTQFCNGGGYDPSLYVCLNDNFLCPTGNNVCGTACYKRSEYTCQPNFQLCRVGDELCGTVCYNDEVNVCLDASTSTIGPV